MKNRRDSVLIVISSLAVKINPWIDDLYRSISLDVDPELLRPLCL
jgi:hypothetical protein